MPVINFVDLNRKVTCVPGAILRDVCIREGYSVYKGLHMLLNCHGNGLCGSCRVAVIDGRVMPRNGTEQSKLKGVAEPWRLSCQFEVLDNITITTDDKQVAAYQQAQAEAEDKRQAAKQEQSVPA